MGHSLKFKSPGWLPGVIASMIGCLNIDWDIPTGPGHSGYVLMHCGSCDWWELPKFFRGRWQFFPEPYWLTICKKTIGTRCNHILGRPLQGTRSITGSVKLTGRQLCSVIGLAVLYRASSTMFMRTCCVILNVLYIHIYIYFVKHKLNVEMYLVVPYSFTHLENYTLLLHRLRSSLLHHYQHYQQ